MIAGAIVLSAVMCFAGTTSSSMQQPSTHSAKVRHHKKARHTRLRGQKAIDGDRVRQIQEALIREHYLKGEPSGKWDDSTQVALRRYQADQGWQSKSVPDSRALIRLGLGPDNGHLLNPESAMTSASAAAHGTSTMAKGGAQASGAAGSSMPGNAVSTPAAGISDPSR